MDGVKGSVGPVHVGDFEDRGCGAALERDEGLGRLQDLLGVGEGGASTAGVSENPGLWIRASMSVQMALVRFQNMAIGASHEESAAAGPTAKPK